MTKYQKVTLPELATMDSGSAVQVVGTGNKFFPNETYQGIIKYQGHHLVASADVPLSAFEEALLKSDQQLEFSGTVECGDLNVHSFTLADGALNALVRKGETRIKGTLIAYSEDTRRDGYVGLMTDDNGFVYPLQWENGNVPEQLKESASYLGKAVDVTGRVKSDGEYGTLVKTLGGINTFLAVEETEIEDSQLTGLYYPDTHFNLSKKKYL
ncbi:hypothetical protein HOA91_02010 [Candidatus Woesearchaeota archaeon]|jgi:hypothetical protein|nr:hypothetical protein [Candidatus Woesearchaeota archaeon]